MDAHFSLSILIRHCESDTLILLGARDQCIGVQQGESLCKLALDVTLKLFSANGERFEESHDRHSSPSLLELSSVLAVSRLVCQPDERLSCFYLSLSRSDLVQSPCP